MQPKRPCRPQSSHCEKNSCLRNQNERSLLVGLSPSSPSAHLEQYLQEKTPEREAQEEPIEHAPLQGRLNRFRAPACVDMVAGSCHQPVRHQTRFHRRSLRGGTVADTIQLDSARSAPSGLVMQARLNHKGGLEGGSFGFRTMPRERTFCYPLTGSAISPRLKP